MSDDVGLWHDISNAEKAVLTSVAAFRQHSREHAACRNGLPPDIEAACQKMEAAHRAWQESHPGRAAAPPPSSGHDWSALSA